MCDASQDAHGTSIGALANQQLDPHSPSPRYLITTRNSRSHALGEDARKACKQHKEYRARLHTTCIPTYLPKIAKIAHRVQGPLP